MSTCAKCIYKPFCHSSGYVCSSFKDKDRYADRNEVIKEFAERIKEKMQDVARVQRSGGEIYFLIGESFIDNIAKELTEKTE